MKLLIKMAVFQFANYSWIILLPVNFAAFLICGAQVACLNLSAVLCAFILLLMLLDSIYLSASCVIIIHHTNTWTRKTAAWIGAALAVVSMMSVAFRVPVNLFVIVPFDHFPLLVTVGILLYNVKCLEPSRDTESARRKLVP